MASNAQGAGAKKMTLAGIYNIAGKDDDQVFEILKTIVNSEDYKENAVFNFMIIPASCSLQNLRNLRQVSESVEFWLEAEPTKNQPGNGRLSIFKHGEFRARAYSELLVEDLEEIYDGNTSAFATDLEGLFKNNETIATYPSVTSEVYMLMLFERGRRSVNDSDYSTDTKKELDSLNIKDAIKGILTLLGKKKHKFSDVFLKKGKFHCFSGTYLARMKAIEEINGALSAGDGEGDINSEINNSLTTQMEELTVEYDQ